MVRYTFLEMSTELTGIQERPWNIKVHSLPYGDPSVRLVPLGSKVNLEADPTTS